MSKQLVAALAGVVLGAFLARSAATAQAERFTCPPSEIAVSGQKVQAQCPTSPTHGITNFAIPTASSAFGDRADYLLEFLLATRETHKPSLDFRYFPSATDSFYDHIPGSEFDCPANDCRPVEAAFLRAPIRAWVGLGPNGAEARVIVPVSGAACPELVVDGIPQQMSARRPLEECFAVTVCTAPIPATANSAKIDEVNLPLPPRQLQKIAIIGDTGCRLKAASNCPAPVAGCQADCVADEIQACNDPEAWPFATIAELAARSQPDLVIHVGDYSYREARCPPGNPGCAGSPWGDNWPSWRADFFDPAKPLLAAAPWVFVRGNHEDCTRSHKGWFYFLDPGDVPSLCNDNPALYSVALPDLQLLVLNTSRAILGTASNYTSAFRDVNTLASQAAVPSWLLSHHPLWASLINGQGQLLNPTEPLQQALHPNHLDRKIKFTVAGHIHFFEALGFSTSGFWRPPGGVFGMSGTALDTPVPQVVGQRIDDAWVAAGAVAESKFGYALAERDGDGNRWKVTVYGTQGETIVVCRLNEMALNCTDS